MDVFGMHAVLPLWLALQMLSLLIAGTLLGCDIPKDSPDPAMSWVTRSFPSDGDLDVPRRGWMWIELDRRVLPGSVDIYSISLFSGVSMYPIHIAFEPVERRLWIHRHESIPLQSGVNYLLSVQDLIDLDGNMQPEPFDLFFRVGQDEGKVDLLEPISWQQVAKPMLRRGCAIKGCHDSTTSAAHLDLSSGRGVQRTAVGIRSRQLPSGTASQEGARGARSLTGLPIIDVIAGVGEPANSYLMYKIMADPHILGLPMPPPESGLNQLSKMDQLTLSQWIFFGVPTD